MSGPFKVLRTHQLEFELHLATEHGILTGIKNEDDARKAAAEVIRRTSKDFSTQTQAQTLLDVLQSACLRLPLELEERFWTLGRCLRLLHRRHRVLEL